MLDWLFLLLFGIHLGGPSPEPGGAKVPQPSSQLDRMAVAVEGVESGYGTDRSMWRSNPAVPQGPMQISAAAAADVGGGDRFLPDENRALGRAYLAHLYAHYGNWVDTVAAYNQGIANIDRWIAQGRPETIFADKLRTYLDRLQKSLAALPQASAPPPNSTPAADRPTVTIQDPALRKKYQSDQAAIAELQQFLDAPPPSESTASTQEVLALIRVVAARPGYSEFANRQSAPATHPGPAALRPIAQVLIAKLQAECDAIVLVDRKKHPSGP